MLDLKYVRSNMDSIREMLKNRGYDLDLSAIESLDKERREKLATMEALRNKRNRVSDDIASMKKNGQDASSLIAEMKDVSSEIKAQEAGLAVIQEGLDRLLMVMPNIPHESVPVGKESRDNAEIRLWGEKREMGFEPLPHWEIGERLGILDFRRASKPAGGGVALYTGGGGA